MRAHVPDSSLRRDIPALTRALAEDQLADFERLYPGPYILEGFQPFPPEAYGLKPGEYLAYKTNAFDPANPFRWKAQHYEHLRDAYAEVADHFAEKGTPVPRMKVYLTDRTGRRIYVDSQVILKARRLIIPAGK